MKKAVLRLFAVAAATMLTAFATASDQPQWGQRWSRNLASDEKQLPDTFDISTGKNIKWIAELGTQSYATPIVAGGRVLIGTNNEKPRDPRHEGDRGVLMCLDASSGKLVWQLVVPKLSEDEGDKFLDWPKAGMASPPTVEGDRVYTMTNRGEVVCLDLKGMSDGNDGPYKDEARHAAPRGHAPVEVGPLDADILWICDLVAEAGIRTHDQVHGSILIDGDLLYVNSCNGVDMTHRLIRKPDAPALVVLDKRTGKLVARDGRKIAPNTFHCTWSSPSMGEVNGKKQLFFGGDDGICYSFEPLPGVLKDPGLALLKDIWQFDTDPAAPKKEVHQFVTNRKEGPSVIFGMPVFDNGRIYVTSGGDLWWGKHTGVLKCIDATKTGDVTQSAEIWSAPLTKETCSTPAIKDGLVYVTDCGGVIHCLEAVTGKPVWQHKLVGDFWASCLVADGKVYAGTRRGKFAILAAGRELKVLAEIDFKEPISGTATAANGVLYVATMSKLYAIQSPRVD